VDDAVRRNKLAYVRVIAPGGIRRDISLRDNRSLHPYLISYETPGTYVLVAETNPGYFAMYIDKKGRKRHSLKLLDAFADQVNEIMTSMRSSQWAKTYVFCKTPSVPFPAGCPTHHGQSRKMIQGLPDYQCQFCEAERTIPKIENLTQGDVICFRTH
jgi:hypothetical protein